MPTPTEPVEEQHEIWQDDEGGPVKSFLEHLEDLRWVLIKCAVVVGVAMIVCLIGADKVVKVLEWPLDRANIHKPATPQTLTFLLGTNRLGVIGLETNQMGGFDLGTNHHYVFQIEPVAVNETNWILGVKPRVATDKELEGQTKRTSIATFGPAAGFFVAFKVAMYAGIVIASPFLFYFLGGFIFPALKVHEKKYAYQGIGIGTLLFLTGVSFCYFALMPIALKASAQYSTWLGFDSEVWRAEEYLSFVCKFMLGMGLGFELPVVLLTLVKIGILDYKMLAGFRRYMIVINLILGAVLTTPEIITQVIMFVPLQLLYEVSVWIAWYWARQDRKKAAMNRERT
ncbi:MAG: Sec-independent protein translocase protein TatC [Verrucomicrobiales bacterium]|jgi:sec-independent protein translocase protein TatC|nr:Sec-independent protein translocase protein TatC [Verrucomicrobiales bacterium]